MQIEGQSVPIPVDDHERLEAIKLYRLADAKANPDYNRWARCAKAVMQAQFGAVSIVEGDRQWFKGSCNLSFRETQRSVAFCAYTILSDQPLIVQDATRDSRFSKNPLVTGEPYIRFYAGLPLIGEYGFVLGSVCAFGSEPRIPSLSQMRALTAIRDRVMIQMEVDRLELGVTRDAASGVEQDAGQLSLRRIYLDKRRNLAIVEVERALLPFKLDAA